MDNERRYDIIWYLKKRRGGGERNKMKPKLMLVLIIHLNIMKGGMI